MGAGKTLKRLDEMLSDAIDGTFEESRYDESELSRLESKWKKYLTSSRMSMEKTKDEREKIKTLVSDISHQTKTPLANILLYAELLEEKTSDPEEQALAKQIISQTAKLEFLIQSLVKMSRLETDVLEVVPVSSPVKPLVEQAVEEIAAKAKGKKIKVCAQEPDESIIASYDRKWTLEALENILDNAVKYSPERSRIVVEVTDFQRETMRQSGGDCHGVIKDVSWEQYEKLKTHPLIKESAPCILVADAIKNPEFLKRHVEAWYYPAYHYKHCFVEIIDGEAPKKADEILLDETSLKLLGKEPKAGQRVTLQMQIRQSREKVTDRIFTVSGVTKADSALDVGFAIVSEQYMREHGDELTYTYPEDGSVTGAVRMDVNFSNSIGIQRKLDQVITDSGYSIAEGDSHYIDCNANWTYISDGAEGDPLTIGAVIGALLLILLTGYLIIYNVFQISVMKDIRYYGLLKTIGTTGRQMEQILHRQA